MLRRVLALLSAVLWLVPGFGLPDLAVSWNARWETPLEAGWGLFASVVVAAPFLLVAVRPRLRGAATVQLSVALLGLAAAVVATSAWDAWFLPALLAVQLGCVATRDVPRPVAPDLAPVVLAAVAVVPSALYAWGCVQRARDDLPALDVTLGVDHEVVQVAVAVCVALLALAAALTRLRVLAVSAAVCAGHLGLVSAAFGDKDAAVAQPWALLAVGWAAALALVALRPAARGEDRADDSGDEGVRAAAPRSPGPATR